MNCTLWANPPGVDNTVPMIESITHTGSALRCPNGLRESAECNLHAGCSRNSTRQEFIMDKSRIVV